MRVGSTVRLRMVSKRGEGREHHALFLRRLSVYGQDLRRLTVVLLVELVGWGSSRRVVYDYEDGLTNDQTEAQTERWKRFRW